MIVAILAFVLCFYLSAIIGKLFKMTPESSNVLMLRMFGLLFISWFIYCLF